MARKYLADVSIYGSLTATLDAPTKVGMLMTGAAAQSANYITIRDSSSANRMTLSASGALNTAGDITASAVGSSEGSPRIIGVTGGFGPGNAARWVFGDNANAIQNGFGNAMQIYAYHTIELIGKRVTGTPPALVGATNAGVSIINTTTTNSALWVTGSDGQTADLTTFRTFAGATAASVTADGSVTSAGASGILSRTSAAYDGISILGRAGGTGTYGVTITPGTLTASQTLTAPDVSGTITTGTGTNTQVAFWTGTNTLSSASNFTYDGTNVNLGSATGLYMGDATHASGCVRMYYNTSGGYVELYSGILYSAESGLITTRLQLTQGRFDLEASADKKAEFRVSGQDTLFSIWNKTTSLYYFQFSYRATDLYDFNVPNGQILSILGSTTNPGHAFIGDADTGMYSPGANSVSLVTGGTSWLNVLSTGEVNVAGSLFGVNGVTYTWAAANAAGQLTNDGSGNLSWSAPSLTSTYVGFGNASNKLTGSANMTWNDTYGGLALSQVVGSGTVPRILLVTGAAMTALTASTEAIDVYFNLGRTVQWATGGITTQRAFVVQAPTYTSVSTSTMTNAHTFHITGSPIQSGALTITNSRSLYVATGLSEFGGRTIFAASTSSASSIKLTQGAHVTSGLADGDMWCTSVGFFGRVNGSTVPMTRSVNALTDAASIATDASLGTLHTVTLGASRTMAAPTNASNGMMIMYRITQGGSGSYTITWDSIFQFSTNLPAPVLSTAVGAKDYVGFTYDSGSAKWHCTSYALGYT